MLIVPGNGVLLNWTVKSCLVVPNVPVTAWSGPPWNPFGAEIS
jgi:hypothetical protein